MIGRDQMMLRVFGGEICGQLWKSCGGLQWHPQRTELQHTGSMDAVPWICSPHE